MPGHGISKWFARSVLASTWEGLTSFPGAFHMLGIRKAGSFYKAAQKLGVAL